MKTRLPLLLIAVWLIWPCGVCWAQIPRSAASDARKPKATPRVSLVKNKRRTDLALLISYPWKVHRRPSVEIRLVTGKEGDTAAVRPLFFLSDYMKGEVTVAVYRCQDEAAGAPVRESLTEKEVGFEILGRRNSLAKPSVCVVHRFAADEPPPGTAADEPTPDATADEPAYGTAAVYCLLPAWAINKRLLRLDLPRQDFAKPGKMHVWFLREGTIVWKETLDWPGYARRAATKRE